MGLDRETVIAAVQAAAPGECLPDEFASAYVFTDDPMETTSTRT
jgi:hypothetical protein